MAHIRFGDSVYVGKGKHRQDVYFNGLFVGFLCTKEKNILAPIEEYFCIPDVEKGLEDGVWIALRNFSDYDEAVAYIENNLTQILELIENGKWD